MGPMISRRYLIASVALLCSCARTPAELKEAVPKTVAGYQLQKTDPLPKEETPAMIQSMGMKAAVRAHYSGPEKITVRVFEMNTEASAFEMIQKWNQSEGLASYKGRYFFAVDSQGQSQGTLATFVKGLEQSLQK